MVAFSGFRVVALSPLRDSLTVGRVASLRSILWALVVKLAVPSEVAEADESAMAQKDRLLARCYPLLRRGRVGPICTSF